MSREGIRPFAALVATILASGSLVACGGSGSDTTSAASSTATTAKPASKQPGAEPGSNGSDNGASSASSKGNGNSGGSPASVETAPLKVSGGGSAQYRVKGGDNSIQDFGEESDEAELQEAATSLHDFYVARAEEDWPAACSHLSKAVSGQLRQLASQSSGKLANKGCAGILSALTPPLPPKVQKELTTVDAGSLRTEGGRAFLIYRGGEGTSYAISMSREDGAWKVGALAATPLS